MSLMFYVGALIGMAFIFCILLVARWNYRFAVDLWQSGKWRVAPVFVVTGTLTALFAVGLAFTGWEDLRFTVNLHDQNIERLATYEDDGNSKFLVKTPDGKVCEATRDGVELTIERCLEEPPA